MQTEIYHYTSGHHLPEILKSGVLRVSEWEKKNNVKPASLWLSLNTEWENTATKMINKGGAIHQLTKEEQYQHSGLFRFVIKFEKAALCSWGRYRHASNTSISTYMRMEDAGLRQNANPQEWYASFKDIPLAKCLRIEEWDGEQWVIYEN